MVREHSDLLNELGFTRIHDVSGRYSVADLFPQSKGRCGLYLLGFSDDTFYIGQSVDIVKRFSQHRLTYSDISLFSFQKFPKRHLNRREDEAIKDAEILGLPLTNKVLVSRTVAETDLDTIVPLEDQVRWLAQPSILCNRNERIHIENEEGHRRRFERNFAAFIESPSFMRAIPILRKYIEQTLPAFPRTEFSFWSLSCMPSTNKTTFPRISVFNLATVEAFVVGHEKGDQTSFWGFINLSDLKMRDEYGVHWKEDLATEYAGEVEAEISDYKSVGHDQGRIRFRSLETCRQLLSDKAVLMACRVFNLNAMRRRACFYSGFHSFQLVDLVLNRSSLDG